MKYEAKHFLSIIYSFSNNTTWAGVGPIFPQCSHEVQRSVPVCRGMSHAFHVEPQLACCALDLKMDKTF